MLYTYKSNVLSLQCHHALGHFLINRGTMAQSTVIAVAKGEELSIYCYYGTVLVADGHEDYLFTL